jgi:hypothetical protein
LLPIGLALLLTGCSREQITTTNKEKIIGVWVVTRSTRSRPPLGAKWEFTKEGEMIVTYEIDKEPLSIRGQYTVEGDILAPKSIALCFAAVDHAKIKKLDETHLVLEAEMDGENCTIELKRK